ncbi:PREDICTED: alpha-N-acetylgalactosamine-specific lectin-like [Branchiostoma belcheri]|uniref:Alpha-N-acetylgalactosamine-specific lectin-like n=1 Tax=Branchiostoma belcheri TaxID=7741 RepID=A0A6P4YDG6_BRABE|nr:PREDICTED: alpha-N-acetylgalactosamine-specific lectin-like [Branchiostoma belcheri]
MSGEQQQSQAGDTTDPSMDQPQTDYQARANDDENTPDTTYANIPDGAYPGGASGLRGVCGFLRARRICLAAGIAVLLSLGALGIAPLTFSNKQQASCPQGYTIWCGTCYKAFNTSTSFSEAGAACRADGGILAMPRDAGTNAFLVSLYKSVSDDRDFWIGLHDQREEGRFEWVDGSALGSYTSWGPGEPNHLLNEDCVAYTAIPHMKDKWNDDNCYGQKHFICQAIPEYP